MLLSGKFVVFPLIYEQDCSRIINAGINSGRNGCEANVVVNEVRRLHTNIPMFGLIGDNMTNIQSDYGSFHQKRFI